LIRRPIPGQIVSSRCEWNAKTPTCCSNGSQRSPRPAFAIFRDDQQCAKLVSRNLLSQRRTPSFGPLTKPRAAGLLVPSRCMASAAASASLASIAGTSARLLGGGGLRAARRCSRGLPRLRGSSGRNIRHRFRRADLISSCCFRPISASSVTGAPISSCCTRASTDIMKTGMAIHFGGWWCCRRADGRSKRHHGPVSCRVPLVVRPLRARDRYYR
jgi:hypothetical protein